MSKQTPFYDLHMTANAKMVDFGGWNMPLHYGSQIEEHHCVRQAAGLFDVSHMGIFDLHGEDAAAFLRHLLANNVDKLTPGRALYTCMLNPQGGVMDDLIVYKIHDQAYRLVVNAGTRDKDSAWIKSQIQQKKVTFVERADLAMLALQGPKVKSLLSQFLPSETYEKVQQLKPFSFYQADDYFFAATGYTGEEGYEVIFPLSLSKAVWNRLLSIGFKPCGLGARDTLRLEAGLNLYGNDMDETVTPLESNLAWTVAFEPKERDFIGRAALEQQKSQGVITQLTGLILEGAGIMRNHLKVLLENDGTGEITSGGYSPTLAKSIALARIPNNAPTACYVEIRGKSVPAKIVKPPFVRFGKSTIPGEG